MTVALEVMNCGSSSAGQDGREAPQLRLEPPWLLSATHLQDCHLLAAVTSHQAERCPTWHRVKGVDAMEDDPTQQAHDGLERCDTPVSWQSCILEQDVCCQQRQEAATSKKGCPGEHR
jgi:hypothetical protein